MPREIDAKKTRKALRKLRRARQNAESDSGSQLSDWETEFVDGVEERLQKFGSAFNDPDKGALSEPLSARQTAIVRQIDRKHWASRRLSVRASNPKASLCNATYATSTMTKVD